MGKMNRWHNMTVASLLFPVTVHTSMYFLEQLLDSPAAAAQKAHTKQKIIQKNTDLHRKQRLITSFLLSSALCFVSMGDWSREKITMLICWEGEKKHGIYFQP